MVAVYIFFCFCGVILSFSFCFGTVPDSDDVSEIVMAEICTDPAVEQFYLNEVRGGACRYAS